MALPLKPEPLSFTTCSAVAIGLGVILVPMGASDFTKDGKPYSYDDQPRGSSDPTLVHFSVAHDDAYVIPVLREILAANPRVEILSAPWSPPGWMKTNDSLANQAGMGRLKPSAYGPLARYFVKFLTAYAVRGVPVSAVAPQNEPGQSTLYPGLNLSTANQATFVSEFLAPALRAAKLPVRIYVPRLQVAVLEAGRNAGRRPPRLERDLRRGLALL
jgi:glucosylceramidase